MNTPERYNPISPAKGTVFKAQVFLKIRNSIKEKRIAPTKMKTNVMVGNPSAKA
ncbi:hypothetical protein [Zobellia sp. OII3]|uniref:hypothetical protein n=1 Tax=Zobellia sp. OII3 TaxID=2034520 RepID=UPI00137479D1|nr:hypothetical protein [Zobellia sp. OII3]